MWSDLPLLGWVLRDSWNYFDSPPSNPNRAKERQEWINLNAFTARLAANRIVDLKLWAIWAFREALEDEPWSDSSLQTIESEGGDKAESHRYTVAVLDGYVPAAAQ
ncbi:MAG: hypothetical protein M1830_010810 [Pleopsidium flavum]|nr:MAG: hypothetical protein M1830_010810 [Pleopsidium flavum]